MHIYGIDQLSVLFMRGSRGGSEGGGGLQPWKIQFSEMLRVNYRKYASDPHQQVTQISDPHPPKNFLDPCMLLDYIHVPSIKHFNVYKQKISSASRTFFFSFFFSMSACQCKAQIRPRPVIFVWVFLVLSKKYSKFRRRKKMWHCGLEEFILNKK